MGKQVEGYKNFHYKHNQYAKKGYKNFHNKHKKNKYVKN